MYRGWALAGPANPAALSIHLLEDDSTVDRRTWSGPPASSSWISINSLGHYGIRELSHIKPLDSRERGQVGASLNVKERPRDLDHQQT